MLISLIFVVELIVIIVAFVGFVAFAASVAFVAFEAFTKDCFLVTYLEQQAVARIVVCSHSVQEYCQHQL